MKNMRFYGILKYIYIIIVLFLAWELGISYSHSSKIPSVGPGNVVVFYEEMPSSQRIKKADATDEYVFFAYNTDAVIAVYNWEGQYLYSLAFNKEANGAMSMNCENNLLYVSDYSGFEVVIDGKEIIDVYTPTESEHSVAWFRQNSKTIYSNNGKIFSLDGTYLMDIPGRIS